MSPKWSSFAAVSHKKTANNFDFYKEEGISLPRLWRKWQLGHWWSNCTRWGSVVYHTGSPGTEVKENEYVKLCCVRSSFVFLVWLLSASLRILSKWGLGNIHLLISCFPNSSGYPEWFHFASDSKLVICERTFDLLHIPLLCPNVAKLIDLLSSRPCSFIYPWSTAFTLHVVCISPWYVLAFLTLSPNLLFCTHKTCSFL